MSTTFFRLISCSSRIYAWIMQTVGSGYCFYFRWPTCCVARFQPTGVLLGGQLQAIAYGISAFFFLFLLGPQSRFSPHFLAIVVLATITGLLHEDGFADSCDSLGVTRDGTEESHKRMELALKDSRLGSFGVSALILLWMFRWALLTRVMNVWVGVSVILVSRALPLFWAVFLSRKEVRNGEAKMSGHLGAIPWGLAVVNGALCGAVSGALLIFSGYGWLSVLGALFLAAAVGGLMLWAFSRRLGRVAGDFIGASICASELTLLFALTGNI